MAEDEDEEEGGGMGMEDRCCIERVSTIETELPEGNARRSWELKSADPKLLRLGGPGSMEFQESRADLGLDIARLLRQYNQFRGGRKGVEFCLDPKEWVSSKNSNCFPKLVSKHVQCREKETVTERQTENDESCA